MRTAILEDERQLVASKINHLDPASIDRWDACKATHRFMAYRRKQLVIYRLMFDQPSKIDILTCEHASFDLTLGMTSQWRNTAGHLLHASSIPLEVYPSVFLWHTFHSDIQYLEHRGIMTGRFSMLYKCPHHPKLRHEGYMYIQELASFESEFGQ